MIRVEHLSKFFYRHTSLFRREKITALDRINFQVEQGALVVIVGPNGAGKSTLLRVIAGLLRPDEGEVWIDRTSWANPKEIHPRVGLVTGNPNNFYSRLSGFENLKFFAAAHEIFGRKFQIRADELVEKLEFVPHLHARYQELSQGMKARLALIRSLLHDPPVLLLDEPFHSVDSETMQGLKGWVAEELIDRQKKTILLVSHRNEEFEGWQGNVFMMKKGRLLPAGTIDEFCRKGFKTRPYAEMFSVSGGETLTA